MVTALGKAEKMVFWAPIFSALPSAHFSSFTECCDHGTRQRGPLPSATLGKVTQNGNFNFFLYSIVTNKFIQTYITYISHPSTHPSAYIISITIYITYIIISAQVHPNKSTSPSQVHQVHKCITSISQVHHQVNNK